MIVLPLTFEGTKQGRVTILFCFRNEKHQTVTRQRKKRKDSKTKDEKSLSVKDKIIQEETSETGQVQSFFYEEGSGM